MMLKHATRNDSGMFAPRTYPEQLTKEHIEKVKQKARLRAELNYRHISVCGVVYANLTHAAKAVGLSARALRGYAESKSVVFDHVFWVDN